MKTKITENDIELYAIEQLQKLGYSYIYALERKTFADSTFTPKLICKKADATATLLIRAGLLQVTKILQLRCFINPVRDEIIIEKINNNKHKSRRDEMIIAKNKECRTKSRRDEIFVTRRDEIFITW
ncbi:MAG: hypothetical protein AB7V50_08975 [Vampirovibrionia bacterium]